MKMHRLLLVVFLAAGLWLGGRGQVLAQTCGGGPVWCQAAPGTCSNTCICSAQDCRTCSSWGCPFSDFGGACSISEQYDLHGNLIDWDCDTDSIQCTNNPSSGPCPGYINPCCTPCNGDPSCSGGPTPDPTGGGGDHLECVSNACVTVSGSGADECSSNADCVAPTHLECIGNACTTVSGSGVNQCATNADCTTTYTVSGTVYEGTATWNGTACVSGSGSPVLPGVNSRIRINASAYTPVQANGTWSTTVSSGTSVFTLEATDTLYSNVCPPGGAYSRNVAANITGLDYYLTTQQPSWWQTRGGDVGANGGNVISNIPVSCSGSCKPYISLLDEVLTAESNGLVWLYSSNGSFGAAGDDFSEDSDYRAIGSAYRTTTKREGYDYFYRLFEMGLTPTEDPHNESNLAKPTVGPVNGRAYFYQPNGGTVVVDTAWDLTPGESIVVFVDGNLTINQPIVTDVGDFVAFIVSGNITFNLGNGAPSLTTANVQGVFVADGQIVTSASAQQFVGEGTFAGWGGVDMNRDFNSTTNNTNPAEFFAYRPDFVLNAPARMKRPVIRWEEVAP